MQGLELRANEKHTVAVRLCTMFYIVEGISVPPYDIRSLVEELMPLPRAHRRAQLHIGVDHQGIVDINEKCQLGLKLY